MVTAGREKEGVPVPPIRAPVWEVNRRTLQTLPRVPDTLASQACPHCHHPTLVTRGTGSLVRCDPENLTAAGELQARLEKRSTYDVLLSGFPERMCLRWRGLDAIRRLRKYPVVADHKHRSDLILLSGPADDSITDIVISYLEEFPDDPPF
jgi:hypothetical protein